MFGNLHRRASVDSVIVSGDRASLDGSAVGAQQRHDPLRFYSSCAVDVARGPDDEDVVEGRTSVKFDDNAAMEPIRAKRSELKRKVSKVGNKKSDKFFGENLSDCLSDEHIDSTGGGADPVRPASLHDELDAFVADNVLVRSVMELQQQEQAAVQRQTHALIAEHKPETAPQTEPEQRVVSKPDPERRGSETDDQSEPDSRSSLNRKAEFLMTMLEDHNREEMRYLNRTPVQEPIIVPKRKKIRHICDDEDQLKRAFGQNERLETEREQNDGPKKAVTSNQENGHRGHTHGHHVHDHGHGHDQHNNAEPTAQQPIASVPNPIDVSPKKPSRDFSIYNKGLSNSHTNVRPTATDDYSYLTADIIPAERPARRSTIGSRLPSHPKPVKPVRHHDSTETTPSLINPDKMVDTILKKCNSTHSFLTPDLMDQIVNKVYGFQMNWDDHDNVQNSCYDDGSSHVAPSSKLKTRKISVIRPKEPILEESAIAVEETIVAPVVAPARAVVDKKDTQKSVEKLIEKPVERPIVKAVEKPVEKQIQKPVEEIVENTIEKHSEKPLEKRTENNVEKPAGIAVVATTVAEKTTAVEPATERPSFSIGGDVVELSAPIAVSVESTKEEHTSTSQPDEPLNSLDKNGHADQLHSDVKPQIFEDDLDDVLSVVSKPDTSDSATSSSASSVATIKRSNMNGEVITTTTTTTTTTSTIPTSHDDGNVLDNIYTREQYLDKHFHAVAETNDTHETLPSDSSGFDEIQPRLVDPLLKALRTSADSEDRRGSIVEHDEWFNLHRVIADSDQPIRREPIVLSAFDTRKLFPFGKRERTYSESSEFFENGPSLSSSTEQLNDDELVRKVDEMKKNQNGGGDNLAEAKVEGEKLAKTETTTTKTAESADKSAEAKVEGDKLAKTETTTTKTTTTTKSTKTLTTSTSDHSTLLKYLDKKADVE